MPLVLAARSFFSAYFSFGERRREGGERNALGAAVWAQRAIRASNCRSNQALNRRYEWPATLNGTSPWSCTSQRAFR